MADAREASVTDAPEGYEKFSVKEEKEKEKIQQEIRELVKKISDNDSDPIKSSNQLKKIWQFFYDRKNTYKYRSAIGDTLAESGYATITCKLMKAKRELGYFPSGYNIVKTIPQTNTTYDIFDNAWNYSESSKLFNNALMKTDIVEILLDNLEMYPNRSPTRKENKKEYYMIKASLAIIMNLSHRPENKKLFARYKTNRDAKNQGATSSKEHHSKHNIIEVLKEFKASKDKILKVLALSALAGIAENEDIDKITNDVDIIETMAHWMSCAVEAGEAYAMKEGYTAANICDVFDKLAINENVDLIVENTQILTTLYRMLESKDMKQKISAAKCVWRLAFKESGKLKIKEHRASTNDKNKTIPKALETLWMESTNMELFRNVEGALFTLFDKEHLDKIRITKTPKLLQKETSKEVVDESYTELKKMKPGSFIFLSYCWNEQKTVLDINEMLEKCGYSVWIDIHKMSGSILDKMAYAVENTALALMCVSEGYSQSHNCKLEAKYMDKKRTRFIPIMVSDVEEFSGWLGILLGDNLYIPRKNLGEFTHLEKQITLKISSEERIKLKQITDDRSKKDELSDKERKEEKQEPNAKSATS